VGSNVPRCPQAGSWSTGVVGGEVQAHQVAAVHAGVRALLGVDAGLIEVLFCSTGPSLVGTNTSYPDM